MRSLLLGGLAALALSFSGVDASAVTASDFVSGSNIERAAMAPQVVGRDAQYTRDFQASAVVMTRGARQTEEASIAETVGTIGALAGAGVLVAIAAVALRRIWTRDPIRVPLGDDPGFL